ncbi:MAG: cryptochrome/photolyase family protein [Chlamydiales bacterium]
MSEATLIFPNQLFDRNPALNKKTKVFMIEDPLFFCDHDYPLKFHKKKLILHRASMQRYFDHHLKSYDAKYTPYHEAETKDFFKRLKKEKIEKLHLLETSDCWLKRRLEAQAEKHKLEIQWYDNPGFLTSVQELHGYFEKKKKYHQTSFYQWQRKRLDLLMEKDKPKGGKWTYDTENRKKLPKSVNPPASPESYEDTYIREAEDYVEKHFSDHYGETEAFFYPTTHKQAQKLLQEFLEEKLSQFGPYQDAISKRSEVLFHSLLSSSLNIGLLTPQQVIDNTFKYASKHKIPLESLEGFLRQIVGWREFMRATYLIEGTHIRSQNFFELKKKISKEWYQGKTGLKPVDDAINKVLKTGYAHHIERLMVLGNAMLLNEFQPEDVYKWFMELFIDSYDWVMVTNVYSMSQYADGGLIVTKPYISSSNYIKKMSDYSQADWCDTWDELYWNFLKKHRKKLEENPRMKMVYSILDKKNK